LIPDGPVQVGCSDRRSSCGGRCAPALSGCARIRVMPVGCHPVRHESGNRPYRAEEPLGRFHVAGRAQHRVDKVPIAIDSSAYHLWPELHFSSFASHSRMHSWLTMKPRNSMISLAPEPMIALCCQVRPLGHRRRATAYTFHHISPLLSTILG